MPYNGLSDEFLRSVIAESFKTSPPGHWNVTRHYMYSRLMGMLKGQDGKHKQCLSISHSTFLARLLGLEHTMITEANHPECNMLDLQYPSEAFDFCVSDQVLEHIEGNPFAAFAESMRITKKDGFIAHTTCFMNAIHEMPKDYWRFTPDALRLMADQCGLSILECGGWGNKEIWSFMELGFRTARVPSDPSHPICQMAMQNDDSIPIVTWVVAQKK